MSEMPRLSQVQKTPNAQRTEVKTLHNKKPKHWWILDFKSIIAIERCGDIILKFIIVAFIGYVLINQIDFINSIIRGVAKDDLHLDSTTIQIILTGTVVEFIWVIKIVINSLFPEGDRKDSLNYMQNDMNNISEVQKEE